MNLEELLLNRFDMSSSHSGFLDHFSHINITIPKNRIALGELTPRGLWESQWCGPLALQLLGVSIRSGRAGQEDDLGEVYATVTDTLPWVVRQKGGHTSGSDTDIAVNSVLVSPGFNLLRWHIEIELLRGFEGEYFVTLNGSLGRGKDKDCPHIIKPVEGGALCVFTTGVKYNKLITYPHIDGTRPRWVILSSPVSTASITVKDDMAAYSLALPPLVLKTGKKSAVDVIIQYENVPVGHETEYTNTVKGLFLPDIEEVVAGRKAAWEGLLGNAGEGKGDLYKKARSAAGLVRVGCKWRSREGRDKDIIAGYASSSSCFGLLGFWDSLVGSAGTAQFNTSLAEDYIRAVYDRQREDGCVPTSANETSPGSTFYPQAPLLGWTMTLLQKAGGGGKSFITEMSAREERMFNWFMDTQDHDRDGLPEWRFTGCPADNSPLYDNYAIHMQRELEGTWCIYLPPIASVSLASFLIMDAKGMALLNRETGDARRADYFSRAAAGLEEKLLRYCVKDNEMFYDYDHHNGHFNTALTLYSFLPIWAGVRIDPALKKHMIEDYLLNPAHFYGDYPLPYLAYSEATYRPQGYWRGRIWLHVSYWMIEALWAEGYEKEADEAANRLLKMMNQREEILENYFSSPATPGGGVPDFFWSFSTYLLLANRLYRKPVTAMIRTFYV